MSARKTPLARVADALASLKLSLFLFLALAGTSIFGTLIQQQADPQAYLQSYGRTGARFFQALGLTDMYHSWWFQLLLTLLLVNTLVCSFRRLPAALRAIQREQFPTASELGGKKPSSSWTVGEVSEESVEQVLKKSFGRPRRSADEQGTTWFAQKHPWARLGAYVCHLSLVLFFLGGIVGARYGFKGFVQVPEGASVSQIQLRDGGTLPLSFEVRCEDFELTSYPDGRPKDYLSRLTVSRSGSVLQKKTIEVNDPLIQDGIFFYQSSYGTTGGGAVLRVLDRQGNVVAADLQVPKDGSAQVPGTQTVVEVMATSEDLQGNGPAAQLTLLDTSGGHRHVGEPFVVAQRYPALDQRRGADLVFELTALLPGTPYTGLQVAKDPGVPFIWAGCIVLSVGLLMALFASHRRVWVRVEGGKMILAGAASKNKEAFREALAALETRLKEELPSNPIVTRAWSNRRTA